MDTRGEIQLQQQINKIKTEIQQQQQESRKFYYDIMSILYSNTNIDEFGNKQINPAINSSSKYIKHGNTSEQVLNFSRKTDWWQSLTYPNEYVQLQGNVVKQRFDYSKQLYADFDYRFCPVRQVDQTDFQEIFDKKKQSLTTLNQQVFGITLDKIQMGMSEEQYQITKTRIQNLFDYLVILIDSTQSQQQLFANPNKYMITTQQQLNEILTQAQILNQLLELTQLSFPNKKYLIDQTNFTTLLNIFQGAVQNVHISDSSQVFLDPNGSFKNIYIRNSNNIQLFGNSNIIIDNSSNIILGNSTEQGWVDLVNVNRFYTENSFCSNNGQFMYYNEMTDLDDKHFCIIKRDSFKSARFILSEVHESDILIRGLSFNYSQGTISNLIRSQVMCELASCRYCDVFIQKSFIDGYLHLNKYSCVNGELIVGPNSFNSTNNQVGILSFKASQYLSDQQTQSLTCPGGIQVFYMNKEFKELRLLGGGSNIIIQNSISIIDGDKLMYDNGPFNLVQIQYHCKENQYLQTQLPQTRLFTNDLKSSWYGHYSTNLRQQQFNNWDQLPLVQQEVTEDSITLTDGITSKDYVISQKQYNNGVLNLIIDTPVTYTRIEKVQLSVNQNVNNIVVNNQQLNLVNCEYDIYINDVTDLQLSINHLCKSIKIREDGQLTSLYLSTSEDKKFNLKQVDILPDLIKKIIPGPGLFYGCTQFNPIDFVTGLQQYSENIFAEVDFSRQTMQSFTFTIESIPQLSFSKSIWPNCVLIFQTTSFGNKCFYLSNGITHVRFMNQIQNLYNSQFSSVYSLQQVIFDTPVEVPDSMFVLCESLVSVVAGVTKVGDSSFGYCRKLSNFDFSQCTSVGNLSFIETDLRQLNLNVMQSIGEHAFTKCIHLSFVNLYAEYFNKQFLRSVFMDCVILQRVVIRVRHWDVDEYKVDVYERAFYGCNNLSEILLEMNQEKLSFNIKGNYALAQTKLTQISINEIQNGVSFALQDVNKDIEIHFFQQQQYTGGFENITRNEYYVTIYVFDQNVLSQINDIIDMYPQYYDRQLIQISQL